MIFLRKNKKTLDILNRTVYNSKVVENSGV
jgi:hypothetical protein